VDSDWNRMKVALIPHSKTKQAVIPDGQIPPQIVPKTLSSWLASCMKKAGKWDAQLADEQKHGGDRRSGADNIENKDYKMLRITIYNRYHGEFNEKGQPKRQASVVDPDLTSQYQGTPPSAAELLDNDRVIVTGAR
jgi:hypothetical protein